MVDGSATRAMHIFMSNPHKPVGQYTSSQQLQTDTECSAAVSPAVPVRAAAAAAAVGSSS